MTTNNNPHCITCGSDHDGDFCPTQMKAVLMGHSEHQPTLVSTDKEILIRALSAAEEAKDFAYELLAIHDQNLGRTLKRHRLMAEGLEKSIQQAAMVQAELRSVLGWPQMSSK